MMFKQVFTLLFLCFTFHYSIAQLTISGNVIDATDKSAQPFATVVISDTFRVKISNTTTDATGAFKVSVPSAGIYTVSVQQTGYIAYRKRIQISADKNIGSIELKIANKTLNEVSITSEKNMIQNGADKKVINIDKNIVSQGGTAADILQTLPGVSVDNDEKIQMRGSNNLQILIDGKPTGARGGNISVILDQIPASSIETIEIMNNPSAKYDPEGTGGIINIVLKKNKKVGLNGNLGLTVGTRSKYNTSGSLNYKNKFLNVFSSISLVDNKSYSKGEFFSKNFPIDTLFYQYNKTTGRSNPLTVLPKLGFDFNLNKKNTLSISGSYTFNINQDKSQIFRQFSDIDSILSVYAYRNTVTNVKNNYGDVTIGYLKLFKTPKREFSVNLYYQRGLESNSVLADEKSALYINNISLAAPFSDSIYTGVVMNTGLLQINYTHPFKNGSYIETGYSMRYNNANRKLGYYKQYNNDPFYSDTNKSNQFNYTENIQAVYLTYNGSYQKLSYKLGLRGEETLGDGVLINNDQKVRNHYFKLFPSIFINNDLGKQRSLHLSYARRIQRPSLNALNPFADYSDPRNIRSGNPFLQPEMTHSFDVGLDILKTKITYSVSVYYRLQTSSIVFARRVNADGIGVVTSQNIGTAHNYGIEFSTRYTPFKWWNFSFDLNAGGQTYDDSRFPNLINKQNALYGGSVNSSWTIKKFWSISFMYNYNSPRRFPQGQMRAMQGAELGMKFTLLKGKILINTRLSDLFNTRQFAAKASGDNFESNFYRKKDTRNFYLGLTYKFGQSDKNMRNQKKDSENQPQGGGQEMF